MKLTTSIELANLTELNLADSDIFKSEEVKRVTVDACNL